MLDKPQIVQTDPRLTAVIRLNVPRTEIANVMGTAIAEVMAAVAAQGMSAAGPVFSHHLRMDPQVFDFEVGVPVRVPISAMGRVTPGELPAAKVARAVHRGPYEGLASSWAARAVKRGPSSPNQQCSLASRSTRCPGRGSRSRRRK